MGRIKTRITETSTQQEKMIYTTITFFLTPALAMRAIPVTNGPRTNCMDKLKPLADNVLSLDTALKVTDACFTSVLGGERESPGAKILAKLHGQMSSKLTTMFEKDSKASSFVEFLHDKIPSYKAMKPMIKLLKYGGKWVKGDHVFKLAASLALSEIQKHGQKALLEVPQVSARAEDMNPCHEILAALIIGTALETILDQPFQKTCGVSAKKALSTVFQKVYQSTVPQQLQDALGDFSDVVREKLCVCLRTCACQSQKSWLCSSKKPSAETLRDEMQVRRRLMKMTTRGA